MERAYTVKAIVLIFQDGCFSMEGNSPALFTVEPDYYSLHGDLPIHLVMLQAHCTYQPLCSTSCVSLSSFFRHIKGKVVGNAYVCVINDCLLFHPGGFS